MNVVIKMQREHIWLKAAAYFYAIVVVAFEYDMSEFNKLINAFASLLLVAIAFMTVVINKNYKKINIISRYISLQNIFLVYALLSSLWAFSVVQSFSIFRLLFMSILSQLALIILYSYDKKSKYVIINLITLVMIVVMIKTLIVTPIGAYGNVRAFIRYAGYNKNMFGMMYAMGCFLSLYMYDTIKNNKYLFSGLLFLIMAMFAQSRKSVLMILMFLPLYIILKSSRWTKIRNIFLILILILLFAFIVVNNQSLYDIIGKRIVNLYYSFSGSSDYYDGSITERTVMRKVATQLAIQKPIFGWGANYFASYFKNYSIMGRYTYCHCNYLELMVSYGMIGTMLFYLPYLYILFKNVKELKRHNKDSIFNIVFFLVLFIMEYGFVSYYEPLFGLFKILTVMLLDNGEVQSTNQQTSTLKRVI